VGDAFDVLADLAEERSPDPFDPVFSDWRGTPIKPNRVSKRFKFYVREAELPER